MTTGATVPGLYSEEGEIPPPFKGAKLKQTRGRGKPKGKPQDHRQNPPKALKRQMKLTCVIALTIIITMIIILPQVRIMAADLLMVKAVTDNLEVSCKEAEAKDLNIINVNFRTINFREAHINRTILNTVPATNPIFREVKQITTEVEAMAGVLSNSEDVVTVGLIIRVTMALTNISITHMINR